VQEVLKNSLFTHEQNRREIQKLWDIYRSKSDILNKTKEVRENINHKIVENRAFEVVSFYRGYCFGEPIQYIRRGDDDTLTDDINELNGYMFDADKEACDDELAEWMFVCGTSYRMVMPGVDENPFDLYALDPRYTFVVYSSAIGNKPMMGVKYIKKRNGETIYSCYTEDRYFEIKGDQVTEQPHILDAVNIIEYPANNARLGIFEIVVPLLNALDEVQSNRLDDIEAFVNSFMVVIGAQMSDELVDQLNAWKMLCLPEGTDAKYLSSTLNQAGIQTLKDDIYQSIQTICGVPNRHGGGSSSDTGLAVELRDGWSQASSRAKSIELIFKRSERRFLKLALRILKDTVGTKLEVRNVDIKFARRYTDNLNNKAQALQMLLEAGVHPEVAFATSGIWNDPVDVYLQSKPYLEKWELDPLEEEEPETMEEDPYEEAV
jgi:SPP1 family phage portal protein